MLVHPVCDLAHNEEAAPTGWPPLKGRGGVAHKHCEIPLRLHFRCQGVEPAMGTREIYLRWGAIEMRARHRQTAT